MGGFAACAVKVKLDGLTASTGVVETSSVTGTSRGELVAPALVILIVAVYEPAANELALMLAVRVAGVL